MTPMGAAVPPSKPGTSRRCIGAGEAARGGTLKSLLLSGFREKSLRLPPPHPP